jgi:hypothetical protein
MRQLSLGSDQHAQGVPPPLAVPVVACAPYMDPTFLIHIVKATNKGDV